MMMKIKALTTLTIVGLILMLGNITTTVRLKVENANIMTAGHQRMMIDDIRLKIHISQMTDVVLRMMIDDQLMTFDIVIWKRGGHNRKEDHHSNEDPNMKRTTKIIQKNKVNALVTMSMMNGHQSGQLKIQSLKLFQKFDQPVQ